MTLLDDLDAYRRMRRRSPRLQCGDLPCRFQILFIGDRPVDLAEGAGATVNLSRGGLCLYSDLRLPGHRRVLLRVRFTLQGEVFEPVVRLVWGADEPNGGYRYGARFWGMSSDYEELLQARLGNLRTDLLA